MPFYNITVGGGSPRADYCTGKPTAILEWQYTAHEKFVTYAPSAHDFKAFLVCSQNPPKAFFQ